MAVIGINKTSNERVVVIGTALGMSQSESRADFLHHNVESNREEWIYVANSWGDISRAKLDEIQVIEIDGTPIENVLNEETKKNM